MGDLYQRTLDRSNLLKSNGFNVVGQWECQWLKSIQYTKNNFSEIGPLTPRNAYFGKEAVYWWGVYVCVSIRYGGTIFSFSSGGRVETFKLYKKVDGIKEKIRYVDIVSLYPTVSF